MRALKKVKKVLRVKGPDAVKFLHGLTTTHVKRMHAVNALVKGCQSFLLNHRGQIDFDFTLVERGSEFFISVDAEYMSHLKSRLEHFLISEEVIIQEQDEIFKDFWWELDDVSIDDGMLFKSTSQFSEDKIFQALENEEALEIKFLQFGVPIKEVWVKSTEKFNNFYKEISDEEFLEWRIQRGLPIRELDYSANQLVSELPYVSAVSFDKGCYLGQEVVAKAKNLGRSPNKFLGFRASAQIHANEKIMNSSGEIIGEIRSSYGNAALGYLRSFALDKNEKFFSKSQEILIKN